jgi:hypothetical protein
VKKSEFDHVIAVAAQVTSEFEIVVIGSQAILGSVAEPPESLLRSIEADVYPRRKPELAEEIDGALGDGSPFQQTYGYYAHGVGPGTAKAPAGWEERWVRVAVRKRPGDEDGEVYALCIEAHDLILAKCVAGRERDWDFAAEAIAAGVVEMEELLGRVDQLPIAPEERLRVRKGLEGAREKLARSARDEEDDDEAAPAGGSPAGGGPIP